MVRFFIRYLLFYMKCPNDTKSVKIEKISPSINESTSSKDVDLNDSNDSLSPRKKPRLSKEVTKELKTNTNTPTTSPTSSINNTSTPTNNSNNINNNNSINNKQNRKESTRRERRNCKRKTRSNRKQSDNKIFKVTDEDDEQNKDEQSS